MNVAGIWYVFAVMYKRHPNNTVISETGSEYYDDSIPFEGVYPTYMRKLVDVSVCGEGGLFDENRCLCF